MRGNASVFHCFGLLLLLTITPDIVAAQQKKQTKKQIERGSDKKQTRKRTESEPGQGTVKVIEKQPDPKEQWRKLGYNASQSGAFETAVKNYEKVLGIDSTDYDALLATGRLYYKLKAYDKSLKQYNRIYNSDQLDVEALKGLGECYAQLGNNKEAIAYFQRAISALPSYVPLHLGLAKAYLANDQTDLALKVYLNSLEYDKTYAEVWAGIGKLLYWKNKPKSALTYYAEAIRLDPSDEKVKAAYELVKNEMAFNLSLGLNPLNEQEEIYTINTLLLRLGVSKRLNDYFSLSANTLLDRSQRKAAAEDTTRHFDNTLLTAALILNKHQLSAFIGNSISDAQVTAYGINLLSNFVISPLKIRNSFTAGYDYFYYWKRVEQDYYANTTRISLYKLTLDLGFKNGTVRNNFIWDYTTMDVNPYTSYLIALSYTILKNPRITAAINRSYVNYTAHSLLYYSPYQRSMNGVSLSPYYSYKKLYFYGSYAYRTDNYSNRIWTGELEIGYMLTKTSLSAGWRHYDDPYYTNTGFYLIAKKIF